MKTLKSTTKSEVQLLMDFDYNNVLGRIKYVLGKEATLFSDVLIKNSEIYWMVRDDSEYVSLTELSSDVQSEVKGILNRRISYVSGIISGDSLIGVYSDKILTYPSDEYVFVKEGTGNGDIIITGWGCMSSAHDNNDASHVEETTEELSGGTNTVELGAFNSSHNGNETAFSAQSNNRYHKVMKYISSEKSENFSRRSVICNILLSLFLCVPIMIGCCGVTFVPMMALYHCMDKDFVHFCYDVIIEINGIIALLAVYGLILRNKKIALVFGITTLYSVLIFITPFFTVASDPMMGITARDYESDFYASFVLWFVACLMVLLILIMILLIRKNGRSALSLLERGGIVTNVKVESLVVIVFNVALIVVTYMMLLSEMNYLENK